MATISRFHAVASVGSKIRMAGFLAWLMWLAVHVMYLVGFKNRFTTMVHWAVSFLFRPIPADDDEGTDRGPHPDGSARRGRASARRRSGTREGLAQPESAHRRPRRAVRVTARVSTRSVMGKLGSPSSARTHIGNNETAPAANTV